MHTAIKTNTKVLLSRTSIIAAHAVSVVLTQQLSEKRQKLQNRAIRVITRSSYDMISRYLLNSLGWDNLLVRTAKQKANLMYKCINNLAPAYLCNLFAPRTLNTNFIMRRKN